MFPPKLIKKKVSRWVILSLLLVLTSNPAWWIQETTTTTGEGAVEPDAPSVVSLYLDNYLDEALEVSEFSGIPPAIILAMGGLESGWGSSELARKANNHFGIKGDPEKEPVYWKFTEESQAGSRDSMARASFRKYPNVLACYKGLARHLKRKPRYDWLFRIPRHRFDRWAVGLEVSGYATDPEYGEKLIGIIKKHKLYLY